jgi:exopolysaccharide biosynthesis polyprenyl glycosylphosphotransferase
VISIPLLVALRGLPQSVLHLSHGVFSLVSVATLLALMFIAGEYSPSKRVSRLYDNVVLVKNALIAYGVAVGVTWVLKGFPLSLGSLAVAELILHAAVVLCAMILIRWAVWRYQLRLFRDGVGLRRVVVAGCGSAASAFVRVLRENWWLGINAVGTLSVASSPQSRRPIPLPTLGEIESVRDALTSQAADEVIVALDADELQGFQRLAMTLSEARITFRILPGLFGDCFKSARTAGVDGLPVMGMRFDRRVRIQREIKRFLDQLMATAALLLCAPFIAAIAIAIKLTSHGPVFYSQARVGLNGQTFTMYKFRTMVTDAEQRLEELMGFNEADGCLFKMRHDPRVTRVGRWLRKCSLDELPQFWNVLRGEMSVVGPRPPLPWEVDLYETSHTHRLEARPGITGLWQVSGRSDTGFEDMVSMDCRYIREWSLKLDFSIMLKTVRVILKGEGAY